jgi:putative endopeptidase
MTPKMLGHWRKILLVLVAACAASGAQTQEAPDASAAPDFLRSHMDFTVDPGVDFFAYANGGWLARNPIPAAESWWGIGSLVNEQLYSSLRTINENAASEVHPAGSELQKIADFWTTAMDTQHAEALGVHPLDGEFARIDQVQSAREALDLAFALMPLDINVFFDVDVSQDEKNSSAMAIHLSQGGLGLPDRDFYFNPERGVARSRDEYRAHLARTFQLLGRSSDQAQAQAREVLKFETALAKSSRKLEELNDPDKNYHQLTPDFLTEKYTPSIDWKDRLAAWNLHPDVVIVGQPEFFAGLEKLLSHTPAPVLRDYMRVHLLDTYASTLSKPFDDEHFRFYGQVLGGKQEQRERWKRVLDAEGDAMGFMLGRIFVHEYFPAATKKRYADLVEAVHAAYHDRIVVLPWMSLATKAKAQRKLAAITAKVGYPDKWKDYSTLVIGRDSYCDNMKNAARWRFGDAFGKYGKPVDRSEWDMTPQTYNAYYSQNNNEIVLPAAAFTIPGVPDAQLDDAVVYGYVAAATIGHEITHGFDDSGRKYDAAGNLSDWWTAGDAKAFQERADTLARQFDRYEPLPGLHINGRASLGENIADYGGVLLGLDAFKKTEQYRKGEPIGGLTPLQRYFLGYALGWMMQERDERLRANLLSDVHAPAKWRVLGPLSNIPEFYQAFGIKPGQPMWRPESERVQIW